jgi:hypothetical protein
VGRRTDEECRCGEIEGYFRDPILKAMAGLTYWRWINKMVENHHFQVVG